MELPPYAGVLGASIVDDPAGGAPILVMPASDAVIGRPNFLHGGAIGGLLEIAAIAAVRHALDEADARIKPINLTVDYMRGGRLRETRAQGIVRRLGKRIANVDAIAWQDDPATPFAAARQTFLIVRGSAL